MSLNDEGRKWCKTRKIRQKKKNLRENKEIDVRNDNKNGKGEDIKEREGNVWKRNQELEK